MKNSTLLNSGNLTAWNSLIATGNLSSIHSMIDKGEISLKDKLGKYGLSPLHLAAWHKKPEICQFLISQKISPNIKESFSGKTPFHIAAYFGHLDVAEILLKNGINVDGKKAIDCLGCYPLHYAALGEKKEMLFFLLGLSHLIGRFESHINFSAKSVSCIGNTLDILIYKRSFDLCDLVSSAHGISIVETNPRIESTLYIGYTNENPWTPFHSAAVLGEKKIVEMLLRKFPHAYCLCKRFEDMFDYSPGEVALVEGHLEVARMLGETRPITDRRQAFNLFSTIQSAPSYSKDLLKAIEERDFLLLDKLILEHGEDILYQGNFCEPGDDGTPLSFYWNADNLNALSVVARLFCVSFVQWLKERKIQILPQEFLTRDRKEAVFFNWSMIDIHPYATGFFKKVSEEISSPELL